ncbi:hypothetical protein DC498_01150 [Terrimonas sp.]|uniref:DUF4062 domain-containing protein n=1 Tax=Terrimonas sp. TaxID=1914338 RepID=UPI000D5219CE|nr:DUF4062 domain-containing protein [Terrimonas sp.]PVD54028.1 hypothetical protein DC498_01150 [Terrimonas sp.]
MGAYSIYISSTYRDLIEDRNLLRLRLDQAQYITVCMEKYPPALSQSIKDKCQKDVADADIYVGIIGDKYGSLAMDENGNQLPLSYTEYEYDAAVMNKKKRLIFFKAVKEPIADERLLKFISKIKTTPFFTGVFDDYKDLPGLVLAAVVAETGDFKKKFIPGETKLLCDRVEQARFFTNSIMQNVHHHIYFFMVCGHKYNGHSMMVNRCIYSIRNQFGNNETLDIRFMANSNPPSDGEKIKQDIKNKLLSQLQSKTNEVITVFSADSFFDCLNKVNKNCLVISIIIQSTFLKNHIDVYKEGIQKFYTEFSQVDNPLYRNKKIIFFTHVQYNDETADKDVMIKDFENMPHFENKKMPVLEKINDDIIVEWMLENNLGENQFEIDNQVKEHFSTIERDMNQEYFMDNAAEAMEKIIDHYNTKKFNS